MLSMKIVNVFAVGATGVKIVRRKSHVETSAAAVGNQQAGFLKATVLVPVTKGTKVRVARPRSHVNTTVDCTGLEAVLK